MVGHTKWSRQHEKCIKCGKTNHSHKAKGLCTACYQSEHLYPKSICSLCGALNRVHKRINGEAVCRKCYKEPLRLCIMCNKEATAAYKLNSTDFVCDSCYIKQYRKKEQCSICNRIEVLAINAIDKKICVKCYSVIHDLCSKCGRNIKSPYIIGGNHVCCRCYENARRKGPLSKIDISIESYICIVCGKPNEIQRLYNDNSVICQQCFELQNSTCTSCGNPTLPVHAHLNALPYCRNCYYKHKFYTILNMLKSNWSDSFITVIEDYFSSKAQRVSYETLWAHIEVSNDLLNELYTKYKSSCYAFSINDLIDIIAKYPSRKMSINDFLTFLCFKGLLSYYESSIVLLNNLNDRIMVLPHKLRSLLISYKESLLEKHKKYQEKGWIGKHSKFCYYTCYLYILTALRFLFFANTTLNLQQATEISNHTIDAYISINPYDICNLKHFITYINKNKITFMKLMLPISNYKYELHTSISEAMQKPLIETSLYNRDIRLRDRIILILMLLYGITPEEIRSLKKSSFQISKLKNEIRIVICINQIQHEIPQIISSLILDYTNSLDSKCDFVFPGRYFNTPLSLSSICMIMKKFNVTGTKLYYTAVNNAMLNGLYQPALLMKSFGIGHMTSVRYYNLIKSSLDL